MVPHTSLLYSCARPSSSPAALFTYSYIISARQCAKGDAYDVSARKPKFLKIGFFYRKFTRARTTVKLKHESDRALAARRAGERHHRPALRRRELVRALVAERWHRRVARMGALAAIEHACVHLAGAASLADSADFESKGCVRSILDV